MKKRNVKPSDITTKMVENISKNYSPCKRENYKLGQRMKFEEEEEND